MSDLSLVRLHALTGFALNSPNARRLVPFYEQAFGAQVQRREGPYEHRSMQWTMAHDGVERTVLSLGDATIERLEFDHPGRAYPPELSPDDTRFQHLGIVVTDMQRAMERLAQTDGWTPISTAGPQRLPKKDGVTAFKFRDPDGHPLEFLQFAAGQTPVHWRDTARTGIHLGIDHSALSVADARRSVHFYESLGLTISSRTLNEGIEQERLDGVATPVVDVISLTPTRPTPHVELLHYHTTMRPSHEMPASHDTTATRLLFRALADAGDGASALLQDPDGHFLQFRH